MSSFEDIKSAQEADDDLRPLLYFMQQSSEPPDISELLAESECTKRLWSQWYQLLLHEGILYRRFENRHDGSSTYQVVVPYVLRDAAVRFCHTGMTGGHLGPKKTLDQV